MIPWRARDYIQCYVQRTMFDADISIPRSFSMIGVISEYYMSSRLGKTEKMAGHIDKVISGHMSEIYMREASYVEDHKAELVDSEIIAQGNVGRMCSSCGLCCVVRMYVRGTMLVCPWCYKKGDKAVVIISGFMAEMMGL